MTASPGMNPPPAYPEAPAAAGPRQFLRSRTNRMFAGVCGGLAETYGADATAVRLLTVIFGVITGIFPMLIVYLVAAILIPERGEGGVPVSGSSAPVVVTPRQGGVIAGIALVGFGIGRPGERVVRRGLGAPLAGRTDRPRRSDGRGRPPLNSRRWSTSHVKSSPGPSRVAAAPGDRFLPPRNTGGLR